MSRTSRVSMLFVISFATSACSVSPKVPDVGLVVVAPQVKQPPVPEIVLQVEPKPLGYFQTRRLQQTTTPTRPTE